MEAKRLEVVPGIGAPWCVRDAAFDATARTLAVAVDFAAGSRLGHPEGIGEHADHDTAVKRDRLASRLLPA